MKKPLSARVLALRALLETREHDDFLSDILDRLFQKYKPSPADRRLATELAYGSMRRRGTLDALVSKVVTRDRRNVEPPLWEILRLGAYQLAFLSHIPAHAALNESVDLAHEVDRPRATGFLNGALRGLTRLLTDEIVDQPAADALPIREGEHRKLTKPILGDPAQKPVRYLSHGCGLPHWLVERWLERYPFEECLRMGLWYASQPPMGLRINRLKTDRETVLRALREKEIEAEPGEHPQAVRLPSSVPVRELPGFSEGEVTVQDESSLWPPTVLDPQPGERILDLCAAPGGKSAHLAELMEDRGEVMACDIDEKRLKLVRSTAERLGLSIIRTKLLRPKERLRLPKEHYDGALVDVPCSNTGVLGRRPEARWRLRPTDLIELIRLQHHLLIAAAEAVRPGGRIVYSTCSIEPEENQSLVRAVLKERDELRLEAEEARVPGKPSDGGYWAKLVKKG